MKVSLMASKVGVVVTNEQEGVGVPASLSPFLEVFEPLTPSDSAEGTVAGSALTAPLPDAVGVE